MGTIRNAVDNVILKQYADSNLILAIKDCASYLDDYRATYNKFFDDLFDIDKCPIKYLKEYWCYNFNVPTSIIYNGTEYFLDEKEIRFLVSVLQNSILSNNYNIINSNEFINSIADKYLNCNCSIVDLQTMHIAYFFTKSLKSYFKAYLRQYDILPRQMGVNVIIYENDNKHYGVVDVNQIPPNYIGAVVDVDSIVDADLVDVGDYFITGNENDN